MAVRITCIKKDGGNHENPYVAITSLNWINETTQAKGTTTREDMYKFVKIDNGQAYVVGTGNVKAYLIGEESPKGTKYVKTKPDHTTTDNLLQLPECK